ncbi:antibiotic biosynthesis monooxygenase, partial [Corynebacterium variabile]
RPTKGDDRYFVVTTWASEEDFRAWAAGPAKAAHSGPHSGEGKKPVATGADLLEFEVVDFDAIAGQE